jgi:hypothetical protein
MLSGEVTFHSPAKMQRHGVRVWSDENPHEMTEDVLSISCSTFVLY